MFGYFEQQFDDFLIQISGNTDLFWSQKNNHSFPLAG